MNMKARKSLNKSKQQPQIDINDTETMSCDDCGNAVFIQAFFLRRLSALMSPTGQEALIPIQVYSCGNCGKVPDKLKQNAEG